MARSLLVAIAGGVLGGLFHMAALTGNLGGAIFAFLAEVPLFLVGLSLGLLSALIASGVATALIGIVGGPLAALLFVITTSGPLVFLLRQALLNRPRPDGKVEWYPPGLLVTWVAGIAAAGVCLSAFMFADFPDGYQGAVRTWLAAALERMVPQGIDQRSVEATVEQLTAVAPGVAAMFWIFLMSINGTLAQGLLVGFKRNLRPSPAMATLDIPAWPYYVLGAALLVAIVADGAIGYIARNLAIVLAVPFFFQGLAVSHALLNRFKAWRFSLFVFYLVLIIAGWPAIVVTALGLAEPFAKMRLRYGRPTGPEEE